MILILLGFFFADWIEDRYFSVDMKNKLRTLAKQNTS